MTDTIASRTGAAWVLGGVVWIAGTAIGLAGAADADGVGFVAYELLWIAAHLALLAGLVGLARIAPWNARRAGKVGVGLALVGRLAFVAAEIDCIRTGDDSSALLPVAALITALGMTVLGVAAVRARRWTGWHRAAPLAVGLFFFMVLLPLVATAGEPPLAVVGVWAVTFIALGLAAGREATAAAPGPAVATPTRSALAFDR